MSASELSHAADVTALNAELARLDGPLELWWRDDDAVAATPALDQLLELCARWTAPLALASIPARVQPSLAQCIAPIPLEQVEILPHGWAHTNHAAPPAKKSEFGFDRSLSDRLSDASLGLQRLEDSFGPQLTPLFTPPWNRVDPGLLPHLPTAGMRGVSTSGPRTHVEAAPSLLRLNIHLDPIDWRGGRSLADPQAQVDRLTTLLAARRDPSLAPSARAAPDPTEPIGLLTHHLDHDAAIWAFLEALLRHLSEHAVLKWWSARTVLRAHDA
ncbi:MAG: polysaccharide deacetylase family protein [Rhodobacteraceae bacterium]|nr:polysaccharide deacetylase family protein [Paracoccaceae bacterium]